MRSIVVGVFRNFRSVGWKLESFLECNGVSEMKVCGFAQFITERFDGLTLHIRNRFLQCNDEEIVKIVNVPLTFFFFLGILLSLLCRS